MRMRPPGSTTTWLTEEVTIGIDRSFPEVKSKNTGASCRLPSLSGVQLGSKTAPMLSTQWKSSASMRGKVAITAPVWVSRISTLLFLVTTNRRPLGDNDRAAE